MAGNHAGLLMYPYPWQQSQWELLCSQHQAGKLSHAYLLKGVAGLGKYSFSRAFAGFLLCQHPEKLSACGKCKDCQLNQTGNHPDLKVLETEEKSKVIKIDQVREVINFANKTAQQGGYRIIIVHPAEALNINAANALLKCLEEPGEKTVIMLVSEQQNTMLATINSRCQQLPFSVPKAETILEWLSGLVDEDEQNLRLLLSLAEGQPLTSLKFANDKILSVRSRLIEEIGGVTKGQASPVDIAQRWMDQDLSQLLGWVSGWLADVIRMQQTGDVALMKNPDMAGMARYIASKASPSALHKLLDWVNSQRALAQGAANFNKQLLLEDLLIRWLHLTLG